MRISNVLNTHLADSFSNAHLADSFPFGFPQGCGSPASLRLVLNAHVALCLWMRQRSPGAKGTGILDITNLPSLVLADDQGAYKTRRLEDSYVG
jgi:hypothetical protein